jgi:hypothetical protein
VIHGVRRRRLGAPFGCSQASAANNIHVDIKRRLGAH